MFKNLLDGAEQSFLNAWTAFLPAGIIFWIIIFATYFIFLKISFPLINNFLEDQFR